MLVQTTPPGPSQMNHKCAAAPSASSVSVRLQEVSFEILSHACSIVQSKDSRELNTMGACVIE
jgi:hypothetical protein